MKHVRGAPYHPPTEGKIERWHQTLKNRILFENYFLPGDLEDPIDLFIEHYNYARFHDGLGNVTPAEACFGPTADILRERASIKRQTIEHWRLQHRKIAASTSTPDEASSSLNPGPACPKTSHGVQIYQERRAAALAAWRSVMA
jgi:hypothetical protein